MTAPEPAVGQGSDVALVSQGWKARARSRVQAFGLLISAQLAGERARFITWVPVLLGLGIAAYFSLPAEPSLAAAVLPALAAGVLWSLSSRVMLARSVATLLLLGGFGFLLAKLRTEWVRAPVLEAPLRSAAVTGILERIEPHAKRGHRLTIRVSSISDLDAARTPRRVRVRVMAPVGDIAPGAPLRLKATLSPPAPPPIPGGYDFARAAYYESIGGVGYALKAPERLATAETEPTFMLRVRAQIEVVRREIAARISAALPGERGAMATALITGERGGISEATTAAYRDSGLVHILSISGLHMAIMAGAVFASARLLLAMIPALALRYPIKKWAACAGIIGAVLYLAVSGGAAATVRAAIMMVVFFGAVMLGRPALALRNVALSALVILVVFPESLLDVGFQMSFAAVVALVSGYEALGPHLERARAERLYRRPDRPVHRRYPLVDADRGLCRDAVLHLPFSCNPALCGARQSGCGPGLQPRRHARRSGGFRRDAVRIGAAAAGHHGVRAGRHGRGRGACSCVARCGLESARDFQRRVSC